MSEVTNIYPSLKLRAFVDDIAGTQKSRKWQKKKVMKKLKEEVKKKGLKLSVTGNGTKGKSKMIASCGFLENELSQFSKEEGVTLGNALSGLQNKSQEVGSEKKSEKKNVQSEILAHKEE